MSLFYFLRFVSFVILLYFHKSCAIDHILIRAQCESRCILQHGQPDYSVKERQFFQCSGLCEDCQLACRKPEPLFAGCDNFCGLIQNHTSCALGCRILESLKFNYQLKTSSNFSSNTVLNNVEILCMNVQKITSPENVINSPPGVLAKFFINVNQTTCDRFPVAPIFVLHIRQKIWDSANHRHSFKIGDWYTLGVRQKPSFIIHKLFADTEYQIKVDVIFPDVVFETMSENSVNWFTTLSGSALLVPPENLIIKSQYLENHSLNAVVEWTPNSKYASCIYHIVWHDEHDHNYDTFFIDENHKFVLKSLKFNNDYTISLKSAGSLDPFRVESEEISIDFKTATCASVYNYNFDICEPDFVNNLTLIKMDTYSSSVKLTWQPPDHIVNFSQLLAYKLKYRSLIHVGKCQTNIRKDIGVPSNITNFELTSLDKSCYYSFDIAAVSKGGQGPYSNLKFHLYSNQFLEFSPDLIFDDSFFNRHFWSVSIFSSILAIIIIGSIIFAIFWHKKSMQKPTRKLDHGRTGSFARFLVNNRLRRNIVYETQNDSITAENDDYNYSDISSQSLNLMKLIGSGEFGSIWQAKCSHSGIPTDIVAVKRIKENGDKREALKHLNNEISLMRLIGHHENVVSFYGCVYKPEKLLVMEFCIYGNLKKFLPSIRDKLLVTEIPENTTGTDSGYGNVVVHDYDSDTTPSTFLQLEKNLKNGEKTPKTGNVIDSPLLLKFARQIASGMEHIANLGLVHRDLAARNVLVTEEDSRNLGEKILKISDFGMCRAGGEYHQTCPHKMPVKWMAPEAFPNVGGRKVTTRSDVWSFGVVLWEMATFGLQQPYEELDFDAQSAYHILESGYRLAKPENCSRNLYAIMMECWQIRPHARRTFSCCKQQIEALLERNEYTVVTNPSQIYK